jgi:predicted nucleotide-binding protein
VGIKEDGTALLKALVGAAGGQEVVGSEELHRSGFASWTIPRFNDATKWLLEKAYIEDAQTLGSTPYEMNTLTTTLEGRLAAESIEPAVVMGSVPTLNRRAQRLLVVLHSCYLRAAGASFSVSWDNELARDTGLDYPAYKQAGQRLADRGLAQWVGHAALTSTPSGVDAAEDPALLAQVLPIPEDVQTADQEHAMATSDKKKVFIIHGRNKAARVAVEHFLNSLDLKPLDFDQLAADMGTEFVGNIVLEGLKRAHGIVVLFTPDEFAALHPLLHEKPEHDPSRWQSRPNVIFEAGIAFGIARGRSVLATMGSNVSLFSDVKGLHIARLDNTEDSRKKFRQKLIGTGCDVDQRADSYTDPARSGDFEAPVAGLLGVSPLDPFRCPS